MIPRPALEDGLASQTNESGIDLKLPPSLPPPRTRML